MTPPLDVNGAVLKVGDFVVYTAGDRNFSLQFGIIEKVDEEHGTYPNGNTWHNYYVWVLKTDSQRNPKYRMVWRDGGQVYTDTQLKSGKLNHYQSRFMIMP